MRFPVIPSEARNPSSIKMPRKERFIAQKTCDGKPYLTSQTSFGMTDSGFFSNLPGEGWGRSVDLAVDDAGDLADFREQFRKFLGQDRLHAVGKRLFRLMMHFNQQAIRSDSDRSARER